MKNFFKIMFIAYFGPPLVVMALGLIGAVVFGIYSLIGGHL